MKVYASVLSADILDLGSAIKKYVQGGVDGIHLDFMDNHYVPNLAFGPIWIKQIRKIVDCPIHVHLMMSYTTRAQCDAYFNLGADVLMLHPSTWAGSEDDWQQLCRDHSIVGVINPDESYSDYQKMFDQTSAILVMTVMPGFGGQSFMPEALSKCSQIAKPIWLDGGVDASQHDCISQYAITGVVIGSALNCADIRGLIDLYRC